jgi:hypothetical protein
VPGLPERHHSPTHPSRSSRQHVSLYSPFFPFNLAQRPNCMFDHTASVNLFFFFLSTCKPPPFIFTAPLHSPVRHRHFLSALVYRSITSPIFCKNYAIMMTPLLSLFVFVSSSSHFRAFHTVSRNLLCQPHHQIPKSRLIHADLP